MKTKLFTAALLALFVAGVSVAIDTTKPWKVEEFNTAFKQAVDVNGTLSLAGTNVTATAAELNTVDGVTATAAELNKLAGVTAGTVAGGKALVVNGSRTLDSIVLTSASVSGATNAQIAKLATLTASAVELNKLASVTAGTVAGGKALVVDGNRTLNSLVLTSASVSGASNAQIAKLATLTASAVELNKLASVTAGTVAGGKALVVNGSRTLDSIVLTSASVSGASNAQIAKLSTLTASSTELNKLASVTAGTVAGGKALVVNGSRTLDSIVLTSASVSGATNAQIAKLATITASAAEINRLAGVVAGTLIGGKPLVPNGQLIDALQATSVTLGTANITTLKIGGTAVTATAAQINAAMTVVSGSDSPTSVGTSVAFTVSGVSTGSWAWAQFTALPTNAVAIKGTVCTENTITVTLTAAPGATTGTVRYWCVKAP